MESVKRGGVHYLARGIPPSHTCNFSTSVEKSIEFHPLANEWNSHPKDGNPPKRMEIHFVSFMSEKIGDNAPPGFTGLEIVLPLLLNAVNEGKLTIEQIIEKMHTNPCKILGITIPENTYTEVDMDYEWTIGKMGNF